MVLFSVILVWLGASAFNVWLASGRFAGRRWVGVVVPLVFGLTIVAMWEMVVRGFDVSKVILPAPSLIMATFMRSTDVLWVDFVQTVLKGAFTGLLIGCTFGVIVAILIDRSAFLKKGLLPIGSFFAALPIVGIAPIMVNWFGFDWHSKSAVVVVMVFFPVLINTVEGLQSTQSIHRDLMRTYAASKTQALFKLRLPAAMPFVFNGLKIAMTLGLIGAIVAEYFGSPTRGMGFRISTGVGSLSIPLVWAEIVVAALAGVTMYGFTAFLERRVTFWHPSQRNTA